MPLCCLDACTRYQLSRSSVSCKLLTSMVVSLGSSTLHSHSPQCIPGNRFALSPLARPLKHRLCRNESVLCGTVYRARFIGGRRVRRCPETDRCPVTMQRVKQPGWAVAGRLGYLQPGAGAGQSVAEVGPSGTALLGLGIQDAGLVPMSCTPTPVE